MSGDITLAELDELSKEVAELHKQKKRMEEELKELTSKYTKKSFRLINILEDHGRTNVDGNFGKITVVKRHYFKIEDYDKAMQFLKDDGSYEELRKVSSGDFSKRVAEVALVERDGKKQVDGTLVPIGAEYSPTQYLRVT